MEWVAIPFSRGSSQPRDWTRVSHIAGRFLLFEPPGKPYNCLSQFFFFANVNQSYFVYYITNKPLVNIYFKNNLYFSIKNSAMGNIFKI